MAELGYRASSSSRWASGGPRIRAARITRSSAQTRRIAAVLDSLGIDQALIVAHSTGASMALRLAYQRPDLVEGILSIDGGPAETAATPGLRRAMRFGGLLTKALLQPDAFRNEVRRAIVANSSDTTWVTAEVLSGYTAGATADLSGAIDAWQGMAKSVETESLCIRGRRSAGCRRRLLVGAVPHESGIGADQIDLLRQLTDFAMESVAGSGEHIQEEQPGAVLSALGHAGGSDPVRCKMS